jgi:uncharacterized protein (TIRG00374 family)
LASPDDEDVKDEAAPQGVGRDGRAEGAQAAEPVPDVDEPEAPASPKRRRRGLRRILPAPVWQVGRLLILALIVEYLVVPQIAGTRNSLHLLSKVDPIYLLLGLVLEAAAIVAYAQLTRTVLPSDTEPGLLTVLRIQLTSLSVSHCVPGGTAAGSSVAYRLFTTAGVGRADVGFALATQGLGSALVLNLIFWVALVVSIPGWGFSAVYLIAAIGGALLLGLFGGLVVLLTRGERWAAALIERMAHRVPFIDEVAARSAFERVTFRLRELRGHPRLWVKAVLWAAANWLLDAASLFVFVGAFGHWTNPDGLLVAYGLANVLAAIPITPGGLGVVEATLTSTLVGFGTPRGIAILGVVGYRLVNFWLPIPLGGLTYLSLQVDPGGSASPGKGRWRHLWDRTVGPASWWRTRSYRRDVGA